MPTGLTRRFSRGGTPGRPCEDRRLARHTVFLDRSGFRVKIKRRIPYSQPLRVAEGRVCGREAGQLHLIDSRPIEN